MAVEIGARTFGWRALGLGQVVSGATVLGVAILLPAADAFKTFPGGAAFAEAAGVFLLAAGALLQWPRIALWAAAALAVYFGLVDGLALDGRLVLRHPGLYLVYENLAEHLAVFAAALIVCAAFSKLSAAPHLTRIGQVLFGVCAVIFGGAHFAYMGMTAPLVPKWLPPSQVFWGYATGVFQIAAGLAMISRVQARLGAILLTVMYALFEPLVHLPRIFANPADAGAWTENAANLALTGAAWVVADSLARRAGASRSAHPGEGRDPDLVTQG